MIPFLRRQRDRLFRGSTPAIPHFSEFFDEGSHLAPDRECAFVDGVDTATATLENIHRIEAANGWRPARAASAVLHAAAAASAQGREELGLAILANLETTDAIFASENRGIVDDLHARICMGIVANALNAGNPGIAAEAYLHAFRASMNNADDGRALYALRAAEDMVSRSAGDELVRVVAVLAVVALEVESLGSAGVRTVQRICSNLSTRMMALLKVDSTEFFFVLQIAEGLRWTPDPKSDPLCLGCPGRSSDDRAALAHNAR